MTRTKNVLAIIPDFPLQTRHAGLGERQSEHQVLQDRGAVHGRHLLPVHGHAVPRLRDAQEGQVQHQAGARVHQQLQSAAGCSEMLNFPGD